MTMSDLSFEPFGETLPVSRHTDAVPSKVGERVYRATIIAFWTLVAVVVVARVVVSVHGDIFAFGH